MSGKIISGIGSHSPDQKRMGGIERFLGQFTKTVIIAKNALGKDCQFEVLAILGSPSKPKPNVVGAFVGLYVGAGGNTYLQGGTAGGKTIPDIKVLDGKTRTGSLKGKSLWVKITGNGVVVDKVLLPGFTVTSAVCSASTTSGSSIPDNTLPTAKSPNGKSVYVEVGRWTDSAFLPAQQGNIQVNFCVSGYQIIR